MYENFNILPDCLILYFKYIIMKRILLLVLPFLFLACGSNSADDVKTLTIASQQGDCVGVGPMKCFYVKEKGDTWEFFYNNIDGFNYEPGYEYVIKVKVTKVENPPMDASSLKYTLVKEVSKTKKESEGLPKIQLID